MIADVRSAEGRTTALHRRKRRLWVVICRMGSPTIRRQSATSRRSVSPWNSPVSRHWRGDRRSTPPPGIQPTHLSRATSFLRPIAAGAACRPP